MPEQTNDQMQPDGLNQDAYFACRTCKDIFKLKFCGASQSMIYKPKHVKF